MKDLQVTVQIRNNQILERRVNLGITQATLSRATGISQSTCNGLETMRINPRSKKGGFILAAEKLGIFFKVSAEVLFPEKMSAITENKVVREMDVENFAALADNLPSLLPSPENAVIALERRDAIEEALQTLSPKEAQVLKMRFGIGGSRDHTLKEVGEHFGVQQERIRQIESVALRKLRHPARSHHLSPFEDTESEAADADANYVRYQELIKYTI